MLLTTIGSRLSITCPTKIFFCRLRLKFPEKIPQSLQLHLHLREKDRSTMSYKTSKLQRQRKPKSASLIDTIKQNYMDYRKFIIKKMPKILRAIGISFSSESEDE
jgi:hypothetical protein